MVWRAMRLSLRQMRHRPQKTVLAVVGIAFPVCMIFLQLGFLGAVIESAESVLGRLQFDVLLHSPAYSTVGDAGEVPRERLAQSLAVDGVTDVTPLAIGNAIWRGEQEVQRDGRLVDSLERAVSPTIDARGREPIGIRPLMVFGVRSGTQPFTIPEIVRASPRLIRPGTVLMDRKSHRRFGQTDPGTQAEASGQAVEVIGNFSLGTGFAADGAIVVSEDDFARLTGRTLPDGTAPVSLGLVEADGDPGRVAQTLNAILPPDTRATPRETVIARDRRHWVYEEAIGLIFCFGVGVAFVVGMAIIVQILTSDIADHEKEYATLKAMGYSGSHLSRVVESQAIVLAILAFAASLALTYWLLDMLCQSWVNLPVRLWWWRIAVTFALTLGMCYASARMAIRKVQTSDPAGLF